MRLYFQIQDGHVMPVSNWGWGSFINAPPTQRGALNVQALTTRSGLAGENQLIQISDVRSRSDGAIEWEFQFDLTDLNSRSRIAIGWHYFRSESANYYPTITILDEYGYGSCSESNELGVGFNFVKLSGFWGVRRGYETVLP